MGGGPLAALLHSANAHFPPVIGWLVLLALVLTDTNLLETMSDWVKNLIMLTYPRTWLLPTFSEDLTTTQEQAVSLYFVPESFGCCSKYNLTSTLYAMLNVGNTNFICQVAGLNLCECFHQNADYPNYVAIGTTSWHSN